MKPVEYEKLAFLEKWFTVNTKFIGLPRGLMNPPPSLPQLRPGRTQPKP